MIRNPRRAPHIRQRPAEGMPAGGWAAADLKLHPLWYAELAKAGIEFPISGDQQPERREAS